MKPNKAGVGYLERIVTCMSVCLCVRFRNVICIDVSVYLFDTGKTCRANVKPIVSLIHLLAVFYVSPVRSQWRLCVSVCV